MAIYRLCHMTLLPLGLALVVAGCGADEPRLKPTYPVRGSVFVNDKPATGAMVMFHPFPLGSGKTPGLTSRGTVGTDGTFRLTTYNTDDGAPAGEYAVTIYWPGKRAGKAAADEDSSDLPPDRLGLRYNNPTTSTVKATIAASETQLDRFDLR
ncbi:MAG: hypothetical protein K8U57_28345 [Planctomycetes bacterium]|nr:hypothetical protein [Planctomycetota bacterium]